MRRVPAATPTRLRSVAPATKCTVEDFSSPTTRSSPASSSAGTRRRHHLLDAPGAHLRRFYRPATEQELLDAGCTPQVAVPRRMPPPQSRWTSPLLWSAALPPSPSPTRSCATPPRRRGSSVASACTSGRWRTSQWRNNIRHDYLELRLGAEGTDRVVEEHRIRCSHFDAFRFFMPQAAPMNELQPTRETQLCWSSLRACTRIWTRQVGVQAASAG